MAELGFRYVCRNSIGPDFQIPLRDTIIMLTARAIAQGYSKMVLRRLYVAVSRHSSPRFESSDDVDYNMIHDHNR